MTDLQKKLDTISELVGEVKEELASNAITDDPKAPYEAANWLTREEAIELVGREGSRFSKFYRKHLNPDTEVKGAGHDQKYYRPALMRGMKKQRPKSKAAA